MLVYRYYFIQLKPIIFSKKYIPKNSFTIIIPARNEAENIGILLDTIIAQQYPSTLWEVFVIDDFSTDATASIVSNYQSLNTNIHLVKLADELENSVINSYKKKAIEIGIQKSTKSWIITTDADCKVGTNWLNSFDNYIQDTDSVFVAAPVVFSNNGSVLQSFQCIDFMALQGITAAAISMGVHAMCNGANLAYKKSVFYEVDGFKNIDTIASGDDMFLMKKIQKKYPENLGYLYNKAAIVETKPMDTIQDFFNQRIRWASKTNSYKEITTIIVLWLVLLSNIGLTILPIIAIFHPVFFSIWLIMLSIKTFVEVMFAVKIADFFSIKLKWWYMLFQFPHIVYTSIVGCFGFFTTYQWKGRTVK
ncbi:MAG: glycosyltransferase [Chitinophagaceae bacterium]